MGMIIHTMPVPVGCSIEFAWMLHCAGVRMEAPYGEGWVNLGIDDETKEILQVFTDEDERAARKHLWMVGASQPDTHVEHEESGVAS